MSRLAGFVVGAALVSGAADAATVIFEDGFESNTTLSWAAGALELSEVNTLIETLNGAFQTKDLVELVAVAGGPLGGGTFWVDFSQALVFPTLTVAAGDLVVLHVNGGVGNESASKTECVLSDCYANAWDIDLPGLGSLGITDVNHVLMLIDKYNHVTDMVPISKGASNPSFVSALQFAQSNALWLPINCGGSPCTDDTTPTASAVSASLTGVGTSAAGASLRRLAATHGDVAADWQVGASSWGTANP